MRFFARGYGILLAPASHQAQNSLQRPNVRTADMFRMTAWKRSVGVAHILIFLTSHLTDLSRVDSARSKIFL
jgi:hypothetical protein